MLTKRPLRPEIVTLVLAGFWLTCYNLNFWQKIIEYVSPQSLKDWGFIAIVGLLLLAYYNLFLCLAISRFVFKPIAILLLLVSSLATYFINQYGIMIDARMVQNVFETNLLEARDLLTLKMLGYFVTLGLIPSIIVWHLSIAYRPFWHELLSRLLYSIISILVMLGILLLFYQPLASLSRNHREVTLLLVPSNYLQALWGYFNDHYLKKPITITLVGADASKGRAWATRKRHSLVIIVVGETARAANFGLNGYARDTTPLLRRSPDVINLSNVHSCGTETAVSLPCMFSALTRAEYSDSKAKGQEGLLDVLTHAGFAVAWRDNQAGCKGVCDRVPSEHTSSWALPQFCQTNECHDEILLHGLQDYVNKLDKDAVLVIHQMGSHGPAYFQRYPERFNIFRPGCHTSQLDRCSQQQILNSYDNTILYTDYVLSLFIQFLDANAQLDTALLYMSDHGESLGEKGMYLHGAPYLIAPKQQTHIASVIWLSKNFQQDFRVNSACLKQRKDLAYSHDNLFHSVLGLLDINTSAYSKELDLFAPCRY